MSFFELDGGKAKKAKPKAKKSTKPKATKTKKAPAKKSSSGKKIKKKGGNFLGTVSELFAPAGWESFVTAAGLLALDRTDNFLRKKKDSKKQRGGNEGVASEEEMTGGARKRRTQKGGTDGHYTKEDMYNMMGNDDMMGSDELEMKNHTGGGKKIRKRIQKGGVLLTNHQKKTFLRNYENYTNPNVSRNSEEGIRDILTQIDNLSIDIDTINDARKLISFYNEISNSNFQNNLNGNRVLQKIEKAIQNYKIKSFLEIYASDVTNKNSQNKNSQERIDSILNLLDILPSDNIDIPTLIKLYNESNSNFQNNSTDNRVLKKIEKAFKNYLKQTQPINTQNIFSTSSYNFVQPIKTNTTQQTLPILPINPISPTNLQASVEGQPIINQLNSQIKTTSQNAGKSKSKKKKSPKKK
jgi:hypothetical protein